MHFPPHDSERIWYNSTRDGEMYSTALYGMCANLNGADVTAKGATVMSHLSGNAFARRCNCWYVTIGGRSSKIDGMERRWPMPNPTARAQPLGYDPFPPNGRKSKRSAPAQVEERQGGEMRFLAFN